MLALAAAAAAASEMSDTPPAPYTLVDSPLYDDDDDDRRVILWEEDFFIDMTSNRRYALPTKTRWLGLDWDMFIVVERGSNSNSFSCRFRFGMFVGFDGFTALQFVRPEWHKFINVQFGLIMHPLDVVDEVVCANDNPASDDPSKFKELFNMKHYFNVLDKKEDRYDVGSHGVVIPPDDLTESDFKRLYLKSKLNPSTGEVQDCLHLRVELKLLRHVPKAPYGWNSKLNTGMVGLQNLGATCYLNALLQMLFYINKFRRAVYELPLPVENNNSSNNNNNYDNNNTNSGNGSSEQQQQQQQQDSSSTTLALQSVFTNLQLSDSAVSTEELTHAFGWTSAQAFLQQDVQEMLRVLLDKLEEKMKGTNVDGVIRDLFAGTSSSFIKCLHVPYESRREEDFYDIQLDVKGCDDVYASFKKYTAKEVLDGDNQYHAGDDHGKQDAEKGVIFTYLPPVLTIHLKRFDFDLTRMAFAKIHDEFKFPLHMCLDEFISADAPDSNRTGNDYVLHSVLVHSGDVGGGHYYAYIRPSSHYSYSAAAEASTTARGTGGKWFEFNDETVLKVHREVAAEATWGRRRVDGGHNLGLGSAYMLVYIKESDALNVMPHLCREDIPTTLLDRLASEKSRRRAEQFMEQRKKMFNQINFFTEENLAVFEDYSAINDFVDMDSYQTINYLEGSLLLNIVHQIAVALKRPPHSFRLWVMNQQTGSQSGGALRPISLLHHEHYMHAISHNIQFIFVDWLQKGDIFDYSGADEEPSNSDGADMGDNPNPNPRPSVNYYASIVEEEKSILGELKDCLKKSSHEIFNCLEEEIDEVEGCGIGSSNRSIRLYQSETSQFEHFKERLSDLSQKLYKSLSFKSSQECETIIFVKIYDPFRQLPYTLYFESDDEDEALAGRQHCPIKYVDSISIPADESYERFLVRLLSCLHRSFKQCDVSSEVFQNWFCYDQTDPYWSDKVGCVRTKGVGEYDDIPIKSYNESELNSELTVSSMFRCGDVLTLHMDYPNVPYTSVCEYYRHMESLREFIFLPFNDHSRDVVLTTLAHDIQQQQQKHLQQCEGADAAIDSSTTDDDDDDNARIIFHSSSLFLASDILAMAGTRMKIKTNHIIWTPCRTEKIVRSLPPAVVTPSEGNSDLTIDLFFSQRKINTAKICKCIFTYYFSPFQLWQIDATGRCTDNRLTHRFFEIHVVDAQLRLQLQRSTAAPRDTYSIIYQDMVSLGSGSSPPADMVADLAQDEEDEGGSKKKRRVDLTTTGSDEFAHVVNAVPEQFLSDFKTYATVLKGSNVGMLSNILRKNMDLPRATDISITEVCQHLGILDAAAMFAFSAYVTESICDDGVDDMSQLGRTPHDPHVLFALDEWGLLQKVSCGSTLIDSLPQQWLDGDCSLKDSRPICAQALSYQALLFMAGLNPNKKSMCVFAFNFTLLGASAVACPLSKMGGPFFTYVCEDDDYDTLLERLAVISGDREALQQCRLAIVKDRKPHPLPRAIHLLGVAGSSEDASSANNAASVSVSSIYDIFREKYPHFNTSKPLNQLMRCFCTPPSTPPHRGPRPSSVPDPSVVVPLLGIQRPTSTVVASAKRVSSSITISG